MGVSSFERGCPVSLRTGSSAPTVSVTSSPDTAAIRIGPSPALRAANRITSAVASGSTPPQLETTTVPYLRQTGRNGAIRSGKAGM